MSTVNMLIVHILQEMRRNPRPTCLPCLGITSPEQEAPVRAQLSSHYRPFYSFEEGLCWKCKTQQDTIRPRQAK